MDTPVVAQQANETRKLPLTTDQATLLVGAQKQVMLAQSYMAAYVRMVLAQHSIKEAQLLEITDTDPPQLVLRVLDGTEQTP